MGQEFIAFDLDDLIYTRGIFAGYDGFLTEKQKQSRDVFLNVYLRLMPSLPPHTFYVRMYKVITPAGKAEPTIPDVEWDISVASPGADQGLVDPCFVFTVGQRRVWCRTINGADVDKQSVFNYEYKNVREFPFDKVLDIIEEVL